MKRILPLILMFLACTVQAQTVTRLLVVSNFDNTLRVLDTASYAQLASKTMTFSAGSFQGIHGLARRPSTGVFYGVVNDGAGTRYLASINPVTGIVTNLGSLGENFSQLTFNNNSTLLGITGSGSSTPNKVFRINTANAAKSAVATLNNVYGQVIAFNPSDNRVYHWTGGNNVTYNSYDTSFASSTNITIGASSSEVTSAVYKTGGLFTTSDWDLNYRKVRATGGSTVYTYYGSAGYYPKGMAYITCSRSITPTTATVCSNSTLSTITLTMSGVAGATYQWYRNNVAVNGATLITLNTATTGYGYYKCRINDGCGQDSLAAGITVTAVPLPTVAINGPTFACSGNSLQVTGSSGGTSQWYRNGVLIPSATTNSYLVTQSGRYNMIKTNLNGCKDSSATGLDVTIGITPTVTIANGNICPGGTYTFSPSGANTYSITGGSFVVSPTVTTVYTVTGTSTLGCIGNAVGTVSIQASLNVSITGNTAVCIGLPLTLTASGAATYTWNTGAVSNTIAPSPSVVTTYSVLGASGTCSNTASFTVAINPRPTVTAVASSTFLCLGQTTTLTASGANTYTWTGGPINAASFAPTSTNSYTVTGTNTLTGCTNTNVTAISVTVNPLPVVTANATSLTVCNGFSTTLSGGGASTYTWTGGVTNGVAFAPPSTSAYSVTGTSTAGCVSSNTAALTVVVNPIPVITVNSGTICSGYLFTMAPGGASTYTYSSGASTVSAITSTNINVSGTSALGCTSTVSATSSITVIPSPTITVTSGTVCLGLAYSITPTGANSYSINGSLAANPVTVSPTTNTNYSITGTGTNNCVSPVAVVSSVSVVANPTVTALTSPTAICIGQATAVLTAGGANTYTWSNAANGSTTAVSPTTTTVFNVSGTSSLGCTVTKTVSVLVNQLPVVGITTIKPFICLGDNTNLTGSGAVSYSWSSGGSSFTTNVNPAVTTTYTLVGTDANGCYNTATQAVTVNSLNITVSANTSVCLGSQTTLSASGAVTYTWTGGNQFPNYPVTPTVATVYVVNATDANGCPQSNSVTVGVFALPIVTTSPSRPIICVSETATITASGASTYLWNNGSTNASIVVSPTINLVQTYTVIGTDSNSCTATATQTLGVSLCTGLEKQYSSAVQVIIRPNPNNGQFSISGSGEINLVIVNELGQVVKTLSLNEINGYSVDVNNLANGVYFVSGQSKGQAVNQKIIVNR